jgi:hypothetical protein
MKRTRYAHRMLPPRRHEARRQGKMAEEVRREPHLPALWRSVEILQSHNPGIVDQDLQGSSPVGAEPSHRSQIRNVQRSDFDAVVACRNPDVFRNSACRSRPPHCERDCRTGSTERLRCLETDAGGPTSYDGALSAEIDAFGAQAPVRQATARRHTPRCPRSPDRLPPVRPCWSGTGQTHEPGCPHG